MLTIDEREKWVDILMSLGVDYKMGKITWELYIHNLEYISAKMCNREK
jgi:hypothetical protein